uniref:Uncharacterized protein n=1 Tax=viral metagenome TaxID=1070528 RepID=A0A6H2A300_9ZZZZ
MLYRQTANIIFTPGMWATRLLERTPGEDETYAGHTAGFTSPDTVTEALWRVTSTPWDEWDAKHPDYRIYRPLWVSDKQREIIAKYVLERVGDPYAPLKLGAHATDWLIAWARWALTLGQWKGEAYAARWLLSKVGLDYFKICSMLWNEGYWQIGYTGWGPRKMVNPDGQDDVCATDTVNWLLVREKVNGVVVV